MEHADEFVDEVTTQKALMAKFMKKHPEVEHLDAMRKHDVLVELIRD